MSKEVDNKVVCRRCGNCCIDVGRTFWKNGNYDEIEGLNRIANNGDHEDGELPCEMLNFCSGIASCFIEKIYGYDAKPLACKDHQGDERCADGSF